MIFKKKELFLLIFLILLQSCSGGRIGNFLESSFNDLEKTSQDEVLQNNLVNKKIVEKEKIVAEKLNGRFAMLGFVALVGAYLTTGQIIPGFV